MVYCFFSKEVIMKDEPITLTDEEFEEAIKDCDYRTDSYTEVITVQEDEEDTESDN